MKIAVPGRRSTLQDVPNGVDIIVPAKRNVFVLLFLSAWLVGWGFGEVFALGTVITGKAKEGTLFMIAWLAMWTIGGAFAIYTWLWMAVGKEIISLRPGTLGIKRDVLGYGRIHEYDLAHVNRLRVAPQATDPFGWSASMRFWGHSGGTVAFDYGSKTFHVAGGADEAEAAQIIADLRSRHAFPDGAAS